MRIEPKRLTRDELPEVWKYVRELGPDVRADLLRGHIAALEADNLKLQAIEEAARKITDYGGGNGDDVQLDVSRKLLNELGNTLHAYRRLR